MSLTDAVTAALAADTVAELDKATAALALSYAAVLDAHPWDPDTLRDLGPKLLAALEAMQLTPRARALARLHALTDKGATSGAAGPHRMDELRQRRARKRDAPPMDPTAT